MGVVSAMIGFGRQGDKNEANTALMNESMIRESTLEDGLRQVLATMDNLMELDSRMAEIEGDLLGPNATKPEALPEPSELGFDGFVPRLMEASLLIGAVTRRMHLRLGVVEGALGCRARPVNDVEPEVKSPEALKESAAASFLAAVEAAADEAANDELDEETLDLFAADNEPLAKSA